MTYGSRSGTFSSLDAPNLYPYVVNSIWYDSHAGGALGIQASYY